MEINVLKKEKNELEFEIVGGDSTLPELIVQKLNQFPEVDFAGHKSEHPLIDKPKVFVRVKRGDPVKSIEKAVEELKKEVADFRGRITKFKA